MGQKSSKKQGSPTDGSVDSHSPTTDTPKSPRFSQRAISTPQRYRIRPDILGLFQVDIVSARNLPAMDISGTSDPFVVVGYGSLIFRTKTVPRDLNPTWGERVVIPIHSNEKGYKLKLRVYDQDMGSANDFIGNIVIQVDPELYGGMVKDGWLPLQTSSGQIEGEIFVRLQFFGESSLENLFWKGIFSMFDVNGDNVLDKPELTQVLTELGYKSLESVVAKEMAPDIKLSSDQFICFMKSHRGSNLLSISEMPTATIQSLVDAFLSENDQENVSVELDERVITWRFAMLTLLREADCGILSPLASVTMDAAAQDRQGVQETDLGKDKATNIYVQSRRTGELLHEKIPAYVQIGMRITYGFARFSSGQSIRSKNIISSMTKAARAKYETAKSANDIPAFVLYHDINLEESVVPDGGFPHFNAFFYRKLKPGVREICKEPNCIVSNSDARVLVFPSVTEATTLWVKGKSFSVQKLLGETESPIPDPTVIINRLAPQDYHRFHVSVSGKIVSIKNIPGEFYTVNPIAIRSAIDVFGENTRSIVTVETEGHGKMIYVVIGATMVGSINFTKAVGDDIVAGEELGYFAFGGSTLITLYPAGSVVWDCDLSRNSAKPLETLVKQGERVGVFNF